MSIHHELKMGINSHLSSVVTDDGSAVTLDDLVELLRAEVAGLDPGR